MRTVTQRVGASVAELQQAGGWKSPRSAAADPPTGYEITSNRDFNEWPLVFANPLMPSATTDRLVHRAVKIVIEGKS